MSRTPDPLFVTDANPAQSPKSTADERPKRPRLRYHLRMAKNPAFELTCPCCEAILKIDPDTQSVIAHTAKAVPKTFLDMEDAARAMKERESRKESLFRQSVEAEKNKSDVFDKKFQEAVRRAKETPDTGKPLRDFDLD